MLIFPRLPFNKIFANNINLRFLLHLLDWSNYLLIAEAHIQCQKRKTNLCIFLSYISIDRSIGYFSNEFEQIQKLGVL